jgi:hypothetical protein
MSDANDAGAYFDEWDEFAHRRFNRPLPAMTIDEVVRDESESVFITGEPGKDGDADGIVWWLGEPGAQGQSNYSSLLEAKKAGDEIVEAAYASRSEEITREAGLDPAQWRFVDREGVHFDNATDESVVIIRSGSSKWELWQDEDAPVGVYPSAKAAAEAYVATPAPGL